MAGGTCAFDRAFWREFQIAESLRDEIFIVKSKSATEAERKKSI
jgi:hypothetical protein